MSGSFPAVLRLLDAYFSSLDPLPQKQRCLDTMLLYLKNIFMSPDEDKFRSIRLRNVKYTKDIGQCPGGDLVLLAIGFEKKVSNFEQYLQSLRRIGCSNSAAVDGRIGNGSTSGGTMRVDGSDEHTSSGVRLRTRYRR
ncbi:protein of unknown function [Taphrina deformans PYCC 5710]|uniref:PUB domain-containing protein n=1 Tax=Taphrina deformans (strain PYCC 5710 / ATCC 11124 / CBS 356.35 / IMI 108563 / JCM 9778 / NBRC 8474) TaxID=1097556 RepID=R4XBV7_TAPDE|nr:protein of unknown function [Taphrina deformans PYCC 5710]|eukprot:CCG81861.1 protein of unknown function [Taphrina deformans PYCC 5710]